MAFCLNHYPNHRQAELEGVGGYNLSAYTDCETRILKLFEDNTYSVFNKSKKFKSGEWGYRSGSDYFIVDIGDYWQLGSGKFKYIYPRTE